MTHLSDKPRNPMHLTDDEFLNDWPIPETRRQRESMTGADELRNIAAMAVAEPLSRSIEEVETLGQAVLDLLRKDSDRETVEF